MCQLAYQRALLFIPLDLMFTQMIDNTFIEE